MAANSERPPAVELWQAHYLRLIAFPVEPPYPIQENWWQDLTGSPPDNSTDQKPKRTREQSGPHAGGQLALTVDQLRVTWTLLPNVSAEEMVTMAEGLKGLGSFAERRGPFVELMQRWLASCPPVTRLAFVADLFQPAENRVAAYRLLDRYLRHVEVNPEGSDSLLYRINRPTTSENVPSLAINRLATWAAVRTETIKGSGMVGAPAFHTERGEWNAIRVELDINTSLEFAGGRLPQDELAAVFAEMAEMGHKIAASGDE